MRDRLLRGLARRVLSRPRTVIATVVVLLGAAGLALPGLRVEAGHSSLVDPGDPHQKRFHDFLSRFGSPNLLIAVVEGGSEPLRRRAVDALLKRLPREKSVAGPRPCRADDGPRSAGCVRDAVGRIDLEQVKSRALLYATPGQVRQLVDALKGEGLGLRRILGLDSLAALFSAAAEQVEKQAGSAGPLKKDELEQAEQVMEVVARFVRLVERQARGTRPAKESLEEALFQQSVREGIDSRGYLSSADGKLKLCLIRPVSDSDEPAVVVPFVGYVRKIGHHAAREIGGACRERGACPDGPLTVKVTGLPAIVADETHIVSRDVAVTSLVATVGILALFIFGFRSVRQTVLGLPPLLIGLALTLAFVRLAFGSLNLVTAAFIATLLGLGIDFAVHLLSRYNELRRKGAEVGEAAEQAIMGAGPGILTGALTTSGAFIALALNDFLAFSQLGIITGVGLIFVLATTLTLMPAMLVLPRLRGLQGKGAKRPRRGAPRLDLPGLVVRHPWVFVAAGVAVAGFLLLRAQRVPWSYDYIKLMPQKLTSVRTLELVTERTDYSAGVAAVEARSLEEARQMAARLRSRPTVRRVDSVTAYIPDHQREKLAALQELRPILDHAPHRATSGPVDLAALSAALTELSDALEDARFEARRGGAKAEAGLLAPPLAALGRLRQAVKQVPAAEAASRLTALQAELFKGLDEGVRILRENVEARPVTVERLLAQLPTGLRDRLYHRGGRYAVYVYPARSIGDKDFLERFVGDVRAVSAQATGFPVTHWESSRAIEKGFRDASIAASIALLLLLLVDFRSLRFTLLAVAPLSIGIAWMWGSMSLMGMEYTYVNIIAFPLIIGIGVASGVHILHRYRQEGTRDVAPVVRFTGMAVFLSAATTMVGFGSLALAQHQGAAGLGVLLLVGVGSCLLSATLFLPALLQLLRRWM